MDVSSGCWPSDSSSSNEQKVRKKSMNDSGKGSALSRHDEDIETSFQYDSLDVHANQQQQQQSNNQQQQQQQQNHERSRSNDLYREVFDSPSHRNYKELNLNIRNNQTRPNSLFNINNNNSIERDSSLKETNKSLSDTSRTSENITQIYHHKSTKIPLDMITKSIQTSFIATGGSVSGSGGGVDNSRSKKERFNLVPPSFLAKLNKFGDKQKAPVYVIYPNYTLPNLDFIKTPTKDIILSPLGYKETLQTRKHQRPYSYNDASDNGKTHQYKHVADWKSLITLLPTEYCQMLKHIPEVNKNYDENNAIKSQRPMFCMSPPIKRSRPQSCDCSSLLSQNITQTSSGGSSGISQPISSGYRGSSTLLTDSELDNPINNNNNNFVYDETVPEQRPPSGRQPRSILRRCSSGGNSNKLKRNSMFDEMQLKQNVDKRRSVQDPYYMVEGGGSGGGITGGHNIINDFIPEMTENSKLPGQQRQFYPELSEVEINKALNNRINRAHLENQMNVTYNRETMDMDARIRAENFLSSIPKSELKYYAEIASILETMENNTDVYDRVKLKNEVSRALSKKVSFNNSGSGNGNYLSAGGKTFTTPPNSPNISVAGVSGRLDSCNKDSNSKQQPQQQQIDHEKQEKINSNRFKRLQIQWELLSKDSIALGKDFCMDDENNDEQHEMKLEIKSGGSTPTGNLPKSRIPRPVSYPTAKPLSDCGKQMRSPSRMVTPKKYNSPISSQPTTPKTTNKLHTTPKKTVTTPR